MKKKQQIFDFVSQHLHLFFCIIHGLQTKQYIFKCLIFRNQFEA